MNCDICGRLFRSEMNNMPLFRTYKGMPFNCCDICWSNEKRVKHFMEPIWLRWQEKHRGDMYMCKTTKPKPEFPAKRGETWYRNGKPFVIGDTGYKYFDTNGDPNTIYLTMAGPDGQWYIVTEKAFIEKFKREEPIVERLITPRQILDRKPCVEGVQALANTLAHRTKYSSSWEAALYIERSGHMETAFKVSELYAWYCNSYERIPPDSYLLFLAKALDLVPQSSSGPDRSTLKRLLGIKE